MADYTDKVAKQLYPDDFERLKAWRKAFTPPLEAHEIPRLQQLSDAIDAAVGRAHQALGRDRARTEDPLGALARRARHAETISLAAPRRKPSAPRPAQRGRRPRHALPPPQAGDGLLVRPVVLAHHPERHSAQPRAMVDGDRRHPGRQHRRSGAADPDWTSPPAPVAQQLLPEVQTTLFRRAAHAGHCPDASPTCTTGSANCASAACASTSRASPRSRPSPRRAASCTGN